VRVLTAISQAPLLRIRQPDVVLITAGLARNPDEQDDLLLKNADIIRVCPGRSGDILLKHNHGF
jgi:malate/lactate dehydrogenase